MTAQIVGTEIKLIWRLFVYNYHPATGANTILKRMQVSLVLGASSKCSPAVSSCGSLDPYLNTCGGQNEDSYRLSFQIDVSGTCTSLL